MLSNSFPILLHSPSCAYADRNIKVPMDILIYESRHSSMIFWPILERTTTKQITDRDPADRCFKTILHIVEGLFLNWV